MHVFQIDEIRNVNIREYVGAIRIEIDNFRLELEKQDAEYLLEQLEYHFYGETYGDLKHQMDEKVMELQEEIRALREENAALRLGEVSYSMREI